MEQGNYSWESSPVLPGRVSPVYFGVTSSPTFAAMSITTATSLQATTSTTTSPTLLTGTNRATSRVSPLTLAPTSTATSRAATENGFTGRKSPPLTFTGFKSLSNRVPTQDLKQAPDSFPSSAPQYEVDYSQIKQKTAKLLAKTPGLVELLGGQRDNLAAASQLSELLHHFKILDSHVACIQLCAEASFSLIAVPNFITALSEELRSQELQRMSIGLLSLLSHQQPAKLFHMEGFVQSVAKFAEVQPVGVDLALTLLAELAYWCSEETQICVIPGLLTTCTTSLKSEDTSVRIAATRLLVVLSNAPQSYVDIVNTPGLLEAINNAWPEKHIADAYSRLILSNLLGSNPGDDIASQLQAKVPNLLKRVVSGEVGAEGDVQCAFAANDENAFFSLFVNPDSGLENVRRLLVTITGQSSSGKTSFVRTLQNGTKVSKEPLSTVGLDFCAFNAYGRFPPYREPSEMTFFDLAGQEIYGTLHALFGTARSLLILVFDVSTYPENHSEFYERVKYFLNKAVATAKSAVLVLLAGTKVDLVDQQVALRRWKLVLEKLVAEEKRAVKDLQERLKLANRAKDDVLACELQVLLTLRPIFLDDAIESIQGSPLLVSNTKTQEKLHFAMGFRDVVKYLKRVCEAHGQRLLKRHGLLRKCLIQLLVDSSGPLHAITYSEAQKACLEAGFSTEKEAESAISDLHDLGYIVWFRDDDELRKFVFQREALVSLAKELVRHDLKTVCAEWFGNHYDKLTVQSKMQQIIKGGLVSVYDVLLCFPTWCEIKDSDANRVISLFQRFRIVCRVGMKQDKLFIPSQVDAPSRAACNILDEPYNSNPLTTAREIFDLVGFVPPFLMEQIMCAFAGLDSRLDKDDNFVWAFSLRAIYGSKLIRPCAECRCYNVEVRIQHFIVDQAWGCTAGTLSMLSANDYKRQSRLWRSPQ